MSRIPVFLNEYYIQNFHKSDILSDFHGEKKSQSHLQV